VVRRSLLLVCAGALLACSGGGGTGTVFLGRFTGFDGAPREMAAYRGKPVVVNFFASTCTPCVREMPAFQRLHEELGDKVTFVGIDVQETVDAGRPFVEAMKITWELGRDPDGSMLKGAGGIGLPTTLVLDRDGTVVFKHLGEVPDGKLEQQLRDKAGLT
jgi:thiol-disulfide isomerase/thioredoxin